MKRAKLYLVVILALFTLSALGPPFIHEADANPISVLEVPSLRISYPYTSVGGGYVNSTVDFGINVNLFFDAPALTEISYSLDGKALVKLADLEVKEHVDYGSEKIDFKAYYVKVTLMDLSEGNHNLTAYANGMSDTRVFTVNSYYHVTALTLLSPSNQFYNQTVPLSFTHTGEITNAHYYLYRGNESVTEGKVSGNMTIDNLTDGVYNLHLFVTTQYGQDSTSVQFYVAEGLVSNLPLIIGAFILVGLAVIVVVYLKRFRKKVS